MAGELAHAIFVAATWIGGMVLVLIALVVLFWVVLALTTVWLAMKERFGRGKR